MEKKITKEHLENAFKGKKWLALEKVLEEMQEINTTMQLALFGAESLEDYDSLVPAVSLACRRMNDVQKEIKQAMDEWQATANYLD